MKCLILSTETASAMILSPLLLYLGDSLDRAHKILIKPLHKQMVT